MPDVLPLETAAALLDKAGIPGRAFAEIAVGSEAPLLLLGRSADEALPKPRDLSRVRTLRLCPDNIIVVDGHRYLDAKVRWLETREALRSVGCPGAEGLPEVHPVRVSESTRAWAARNPYEHLPGLTPLRARPEWYVDAHFGAVRGADSAPQTEGTRKTPGKRARPLPKFDPIVQALLAHIRTGIRLADGTQIPANETLAWLRTHKKKLPTLYGAGRTTCEAALKRVIEILSSKAENGGNSNT